VVSVYYPGDETLGNPTTIPSKGKGSANSIISGVNKNTNTARILQNVSNDQLYVFDYPQLPYESIVTVSGIDYSNLSSLSEITDSSDNEFIVSTVISSPSFKQYSGKVLQTKRTSRDLKLTTTSGTLSRIIRINMIKGL
jgi:hypothetical protein